MSGRSSYQMGHRKVGTVFKLIAGLASKRLVLIPNPYPPPPPPPPLIPPRRRLLDILWGMNIFWNNTVSIFILSLVPVYNCFVSKCTLRCLFKRQWPYDSHVLDFSSSVREGSIGRDISVSCSWAKKNYTLTVPLSYQQIMIRAT